MVNTKKQKLIERYGADMRLPDFREEIGKCRRHGQMHDACMVRYRWQDGGYTGKKIVPRSVESLAPIIGPWCELIFMLRAHNNQ